MASSFKSGEGGKCSAMNRMKLNASSPSRGSLTHDNDAFEGATQ
jgi:hypothetical protein